VDNHLLVEMNVIQAWKNNDMIAAEARRKRLEKSLADKPIVALQDVDPFKV